MYKYQKVECGEYVCFYIVDLGLIIRNKKKLNRYFFIEYGGWQVIFGEYSGDRFV